MKMFEINYDRLCNWVSFSTFDSYIKLHHFADSNYIDIWVNCKHTETYTDAHTNKQE